MTSWKRERLIGNIGFAVLGVFIVIALLSWLLLLVKIAAGAEGDLIQSECRAVNAGQLDVEEMCKDEPPSGCSLDATHNGADVAYAWCKARVVRVQRPCCQAREGR